ncbi:MAG: transposase [Myxococcota bacterium]
MTLHRSHLPPTSLSDIAISALAGQGQYGAVTQIADAHDISRQAVYRIRETGEQALLNAFSPQALPAWTPEVPKTTLDRAIVALYTIAPDSIDDIVDLLPILYGGRTHSHGYIHKIIRIAEQSAHDFLELVDLSPIDAVAIDEMFWHKTPLLTGIDLDTGYRFSAEKVRQRSGPEWVSRLQALKQNGLQPSIFIKDAGLAMAEAVTQVFPDADQRDDLFHAVALLNETGRTLENGAYRAINRFDEIDAKRQRAKTGSSKRRSLGQDCRHQRSRMEASIERFDTFERLSEEVKGLLRLCDPGSGQLRCAEAVRRRLPALADQIKKIGGKRARKVARYLKNRVEGLCSYLESLSDALDSAAQVIGDERLVGAMLRAYQANLLAGRGQRWQREERAVELKASVAELVALAGRPERLVRVVEVVVPVLTRRHRASSAIENLHSVLRPSITVHKRVSQGFLDLFRFYWNTRIRRWGRHKGTSALGLLTGQTHEDWLTLLGFPPA